MILLMEKSWAGSYEAKVRPLEIEGAHKSQGDSFVGMVLSLIQNCRIVLSVAAFAWSDSISSWDDRIQWPDTTRLYAVWYFNFSLELLPAMRPDTTGFMPCGTSTSA